MDAGQTTVGDSGGEEIVARTSTSSTADARRMQRRNASTASESVKRGGSKASLRLELYATLAAIDIVALAVSFMVANLIRTGSLFDEQGRDLFIIVGPIFIATALNNDAYGLAALKSPKHGIERCARSLLFACVIVLGILFYLKAGSTYSRQIFGVGAGLTMVLCASARWLFGQWAGKRYRWRFTNEILLVDGMTVYPQGGEIVLIADDLQWRPTNDDPALLDRMGRLLKNSDRIILACAPPQRVAWVSVLKGIGVDVEVLAPELDEVGALKLCSYEGRATLLVGSRPLGLFDKLVKRLLDLVVATMTLLLLAPLMIAVTVAIKLDSPGPAFFRQQRVGEGNRLFWIIKFRSMRIDLADADGQVSAGREDHRATRVGHFLRKTSLDELPQLLNVLANDMSIVGPRPHALASTAEDQLFWKIDDRYWERHGIKPGITGLAQVRGFRGATATRGDVTNRVQSDLEYLVGWSLGRDLMIMLRTIKVLVHRNAF